MLNRNQRSINESKTKLMKHPTKFGGVETTSKFGVTQISLTRLLICTLAFYTFGCAKKVTFSALEDPNTINVAQSISICEQASKGRYNLDKCSPTNSQKCVGQKYGKVTCYTRVNKTCEEGGMHSISRQCKDTDLKKCERTGFAGKTCYHLVDKTCNDLNLYASKSLCDSRRSNIQKCESVSKSRELTCWKPEINGELFVSEQFLQPEYKRRKVDILIVNDNSVSMHEDQIKMSRKLNSFIGELQNVDWHIGITTTDLSDGEYSSKGKLLNMSDANGITNTKFITANTPGKEELFRHTIQRPESTVLEEHFYCFRSQELVKRSSKERKRCKDLPQTSSGEEQPIGAIVNAIELRNSHNRGFFRDEADLAIVVLTDEDESIPTVASRPIYYPSDVTSTVRNVWGEEKQVSVYGIMIEPGDSQCLNEQKAQQFRVSYATTIADLSSATNGLTGSICDADYGPTLKNIGRNIVNVVNQFELANTPANGTLSVHIHENGNRRKLSLNEYSLNNKIINLRVRVTPSTKLEVNYIPQI